MIQGQFAVPGKIDIRALFDATDFTLAFKGKYKHITGEKKEAYLQHHQDKYHYVLHKILEGRVFNASLTSEGFTCLSSRALENFLGGRYASEVVDVLLALGVIECDGQYIKGVKSYGYRIAPAFVSKSILRLVYKSEVWDNKLALQRAKYLVGKVDDWQYRNLTKLGIRLDDALAYIDGKLANSCAVLDTLIEELSFEVLSSSDISLMNNLLALFLSDWKERRVDVGVVYSLMYTHPVPTKQLEKQQLTAYQILTNQVTNQYETDQRSIRMIADQQYIFEQPDPTSRLYTNLSNLTGDIRPFLVHRESSSQMVNLDIRNSQPYLFSLLLMDEYKGQELPFDVRQYIDLTATGKFYEYVMTKLNIPLTERKQFKIDFFGKIFYCTSYYSKRTPEGKWFGEAFPNVTRIINQYKQACYKDLAVTMQRREAQLILKTIGGELEQRGIWYGTIHDSVITLKEHAEDVKKLILEAFRQAVGVPPTVNEEVLT